MTNDFSMSFAIKETRCALINSQQRFMKYYRLLRNNKESGPYSAEDLIKAGFKPYDLVWEEGRSAAWRYPSEVADFKDFAAEVEEQPFDRFYKKDKPAMQSKLPGNQSISVAVITEPSTLKKEKPRIRIKAETSKIENVKQFVPEPSPVIKPPSKTSSPKENNKISDLPPQQSKPEWGNMWLDWEEEKKAVKSLKFKPEPAIAREPEIEIETKFSQSLDDVKKLYLEKVLNGKKPAIGFEQYKAYMGIAVISLCVLAIGIWVGIRWTGDSETKAHLLGNSPKQEQTKQVSEVDESSVEPVNAEEDKNKSAAVIIIPIVEKNSTLNTAKNKSPNKSISTKPDGKQNVAINNSKSIRQQPAATKISGPKQNDVPENVALPKKQDAAAPTTKKAEKNIDDYVALRSVGNSGATSASYKVENISDVALEMVMIDLQYYDAAGRFKKGETIYVRNINPGQSVSVKAPEDANASKITSKISMISSEQNNLYLIAD